MGWLTALLLVLPAELVLSHAPYPTSSGFFDFDLTNLETRSEPLSQHIPLYYRSKRSQQSLTDWALKERARIRSKYNATDLSLTPLRRRQQAAWPPPPSSGFVNITNFQADSEYFAPIQVGTPPQSYNVILDTGSSDFWLASADCSNSTCGLVPRYNATASNSSVDLSTDFSIRYGQGDASGGLWNDSISMGGQRINSSFGVCDKVTVDLLAGNVSGVIGLGFQKLAASKTVPFWENLVNYNLAGLLPSNLTFPGFAISLTRFVNITTASDFEPGGVFSLGALHDESFNGPINFIDVPAGLQSYWLIPMQSLWFNGTNVTGADAPNAAIDTGTTLIGGPPDVIEDIYSLIPGSMPLSGDFEGYWTFPCDAQFTVALQFGGLNYSLSEPDFNLGVFSPGTTLQPAQCLGVFFDLNLSAGSAALIQWVIGAAFLKNVYSVYRVWPTIAVGFAELNTAVLKPLYPTQSASALPSLHSGGFGAPKGQATETASQADASRGIQTITQSSDALAPRTWSSTALGLVALACVWVLP